MFVIDMCYCRGDAIRDIVAAYIGKMEGSMLFIIYSASCAHLSKIQQPVYKPTNFPPSPP